MKKRLFLVLAITLCATGAFLVSCDKDDDNGQACTCINWAVGRNEELSFNTAAYGASDCDDLSEILSSKDGDYECW